jgi:hypothetical protein
MAGRAVKRQQLSRRFPQASLGAVPLDGAADFACGGEADADARFVVGAAQGLDRHAAAR